MSDLRQRLEAEGFFPGTWSEPVGERSVTVDEALAVFAHWLNERGAGYAVRGAEGDPAAETLFIRAAECAFTADEITGKEGEHA